jgi:hypothetical protein
MKVNFKNLSLHRLKHHIAAFVFVSTASLVPQGDLQLSLPRPHSLGVIVMNRMWRLRDDTGNPIDATGVEHVGGNFHLEL